MPATTFEPEDAGAAAVMLADAAAERVMCAPEGGRTKLRPGGRADVRPVSSRRLTAGLAHYAGDLVATAPAGATLADVNAVLAAERQWLALDPPFPERATIGGIVASNDSGPRRHRYGTPRDLIIGIEVALTNGRVARSGGRVVKNVAGYDLARLFCGSYGSLGMITSVTFKLAPIAPSSRTVVARFATARQAASCAVALSHTGLTPSAVEVVSPDPRLLVRFDTTRRAAESLAAETAALLAADSHEVAILADDREAEAWREHAGFEAAGDGLTASVSVLPTATGDAIDTIARLATHFGLTWSLTGRVALGVLRPRVCGEPAALTAFAADLRDALAGQSGHVHLLSAPEPVLDSVTEFGPVGSAAEAALAIKRRFDPAGVLPYPWGRG